MSREKWEQAPRAERIRICKYYSLYLAKVEGRNQTVEELDEAWEGCWFDVIKFTFGPDSWDLQIKMTSVKR